MDNSGFVTKRNFLLFFRGVLLKKNWQNFATWPNLFSENERKDKRFVIFRGIFFAIY
jgi:hypothetical protein